MATFSDTGAGAGDALRRVFADWQWWLALAFGPIFWAALYLFGSALADARWPLAQPLTFLKLALLAPVAEELLFRGLLQGWLLRRPWAAARTAGVSLANVLTSVVFTAAHFFYHAPLWAAAVFAPSLAFGYFRDRHARVLPAALLHVAYNAGYFCLFFQPAAR